MFRRFALIYLVSLVLHLQPIVFGPRHQRASLQASTKAPFELCMLIFSLLQFVLFLCNRFLPHSVTDSPDDEEEIDGNVEPAYSLGYSRLKRFLNDYSMVSWMANLAESSSSSSSKAGPSAVSEDAEIEILDSNSDDQKMLMSPFTMHDNPLQAYLLKLSSPALRPPPLSSTDEELISDSSGPAEPAISCFPSDRSFMAFLCICFGALL